MIDSPVRQKVNTPTVLVVEDNPDELSNDCRIIGAHFPVLSATCGKDALYSARHAHPTVIILDVMMPGGINGFEVFQRLSRDPLTRDIPVIFLSAVNRTLHLLFDAREIGRHLGNEPIAFLEKPVTPELLLQTVIRTLAKTPTRPLNTGRDE